MWVQIRFFLRFRISKDKKTELRCLSVCLSLTLSLSLFLVVSTFLCFKRTNNDLKILIDIFERLYNIYLSGTCRDIDFILFSHELFKINTKHIAIIL